MLYYPFANAPVPVLQQAVLYWDSLSTVVPPGWQTRLSDRMREVQDAGLFRPIEPYRSYRPVTLDQIDDDLDFALQQIPVDDLMVPGNAPDIPAGTLHQRKMHQSVVDELVRRGLVATDPDRPYLLYGSPALMLIVVSLIAGQIAYDANDRNGCGPAGLHPHTDMVAAHRLNVAPLRGRAVTGCWQVDIGPLLPVPRSDVMISDLVRFRTRYDAERQRLMIAIDRLLHELRQEGRHPADAFRLVDHEVNEALADLTGAARSAKVALVIRGLAVTIATAAGFGVGVPELAAPLGVVGGMAINIATNQMRRPSYREGRNPAVYNYLYRARKDLDAVPHRDLTGESGWRGISTR